MLAHVKRFLEVAFAICEWALIALLVGMVAVVSLTVYMRYFQGEPPQWSITVSKILMIWFSFLGIALAIRTGTHIALEAIVARMPSPIRRAVHRVNNVLIFGTGLFFLIYGHTLTRFGMRSVEAGISIPTGVKYAIIPVAGVFVMLFALEEFIAMRNVDRSTTE